MKPRSSHINRWGARLQEGQGLGHQQKYSYHVNFYQLYFSLSFMSHAHPTSRPAWFTGAITSIIASLNVSVENEEKFYQIYERRYQNPRKWFCGNPSRLTDVSCSGVQPHRYHCNMLPWIKENNFLHRLTKPPSPSYANQNWPFL